MVDVLLSAPEALTHREKLLLVTLAEDANDDTRITWNSVERPEVLRGAKVSRSQLYAVIKSLITKGALTKLSAGQKNGTAKYEIPKFPDSQCQEIADTEPPSQGPENRDTDHSQSPGIPDADAVQCPETPDTENEGQCQGFADTDGSQCQEIRDVSVRDSGTPTPLSPLKEGEEEETSSRPAEQLEAFGAFWLTYPKRINRGKAQERWIEAMRKGVNPTLIVTAARNYARSVAGKDPQYTSYPANWLANERYHDEYPEAPAGQPDLHVVGSQKHRPFQPNPKANYHKGFGA
ncbi:hypothetical protein J7E97_07910 [Streptomyces sp. ISL-66]|uniref:hypothetical protein n=1 Tax=Streptomyces sp. ISL-66 TaxID=2819186 RepID=UPI001BEA6DBC|nr:hypothetical protein [Streptomyces sp. ISL-66]MBT2467798.1 hypothetical protein [Streptomyces sp. ISL-66]